MDERGWTDESINDTINNPDRTEEARDTRWNSDGTRNDEAATGYINEDNSYVVRNVAQAIWFRSVIAMTQIGSLRSMADVSAEPCGAFPNDAVQHGRSVYFPIAATTEVTEFIRSRGWRVLGFEGFHPDGTGIRPDLDYIADLGSSTDPQVVDRILAVWLEDPNLLINFTVLATG